MVEESTRTNCVRAPSRLAFESGRLILHVAAEVGIHREALHRLRPTPARAAIA